MRGDGVRVNTVSTIILVTIVLVCTVWGADVEEVSTDTPMLAPIDTTVDTLITTVQADSADISTSIDTSADISDASLDTSTDTLTGTLVDTSQVVAFIDDLDDVNDSAAVAAAVINPDDLDDLDLAALMISDADASDARQRMDLVRREYNYSRQIRLAIVMMCFIAVILSTTQSMNPR